MKRIILYFTGLFLLVSCDNQANKTTGTTNDTTTSSSETVSFTPTQLTNASISTGTPVAGETASTIVLQGRVDVSPQGLVSISFPLGGYVRSTTLIPGMPVKKGQVLAVMEDLPFVQLQQDYLTAKLESELAETEYSRQKELNSTKASSDKVLQQAQTDRERKQILLQALAQKLRLIGIDPARLKAGNLSKEVNILSPVNGYVSKVNVHAGSYTSPADVLFELVDPSKVHLVLFVFGPDLEALAPGQQLLAYTNTNPGKKHPAEVIYTGKNLDPNQMTEVHCHFKKPDDILVPGLFMNGEVAVNNRKALLVPGEAVVRWENRSYVFTEKGNGLFEMTPVTTGPGSNGMIQVTGINVHTRVITKNAYTALMKLKNKGE